MSQSTSSSVVSNGFGGTYDMVHGGFLDSIGHLLDAGVKVHMMYGDRDYPCNWVGGQAASLAVPYSKADEFAAAGYEPMITLDGIKGMTRQYGNFSFTRVFQAGHEVPAYQGQAAYEIFRRATFGLDVPTGSFVTDDKFATVGPSDVWNIKGVPPTPQEPKCYILAPMTCVPKIWDSVIQGAVTVKDWFVVQDLEANHGKPSDSQSNGVVDEL
ncbi:hypothetical protein N0V82_002186 [Gnomoniopsis sp. IMI 355080]|nr:hypothetical protein N0V82_002186 [Gnomoniopsis sp. IMI 355080]